MGPGRLLLMVRSICKQMRLSRDLAMMLITNLEQVCRVLTKIEGRYLLLQGVTVLMSRIEGGRRG